MRESTSFFQDGMRKLFRNPLAVGSLIVLILLLITIVVAPLIVPYSYSGMITVKGRAVSDATVHVRSSRQNTARQIAEFPVGTLVTVFSQEGKWSEIDVGGWHCYILSEFLTLQEPLLSAGAETGGEN